MALRCCRNWHGLARSFSTSAKSWLRLVQYEQSGKRRLGVETRANGAIINLPEDSGFPDNSVSFFGGGSEMIRKATKYMQGGVAEIPRSEVKLLAPITEPRKIICVGMNYRDHCKETNTPIPKEPLIFNKFPTTIIGDKENIILPKLSDTVDWEVELAIVIGSTGKDIPIENAANHIGGYTVALDVSARDWFGTMNGGQWLLGKSFDTFCPLGPAIATKEEIPDPNNLKISCRVNGDVMQESCTDQLIFQTNYCVSWASQFCTLEPGDLILTGTPPGVGACREPPIFLKRGDVVTCEIERIGRIENAVI